MPKHLKIIGAVIILFILINTAKNVLFTPLVNLHNTHVSLENQLKQATEEQYTSWDSFFAEYKDHQENTTINKETFLEVTHIIMSNRKDGEQLSWKWVKENQQIPYEEFTSFYKHLTSFINTRHSFNREIEVKKQNIVKQQNMLLEIYPNNFYNRILKITPLKYTPGFLNSDTRKLFNLK